MEKCVNLIGNLNGNYNFRNPTNDDIGKSVYYENGKCIGHLKGFVDDVNDDDPRVTLLENTVTNGYEISYKLSDMYVKIDPLIVGKSKRRRTKKTRRGKSKRRGRKTR